MTVPCSDLLEKLLSTNKRLIRLLDNVPDENLFPKNESGIQPGNFPLTNSSNSVHRLTGSTINGTAGWRLAKTTQHIELFKIKYRINLNIKSKQPLPVCHTFRSHKLAGQTLRQSHLQL